MEISKENREITMLLQQLSNATGIGEGKSFFEEGYADDVKQRVPDMEKALNELKSYLERV